MLIKQEFKDVEAWFSEHWNVISKTVIGHPSHEIFLSSSIPTFSPQKMIMFQSSIR